MVKHVERVTAGLLALALAAAVPMAGSSSTTPPVADAAAAATPAPRVVEGHRYSDPIWYPLDREAWISCAKTNCVNGDGTFQHGEWEQDWTGEINETSEEPFEEVHPIYAAGSGQAHIVRNDKSCRKGSEGDGTILAIDHGGGRWSVYKHLDITVADDAWVTPATQVGTMNSWGSGNCKITYLHFEVQNRVTGERVPFNDARACLQGRERIWPDDLVPYDENPNDDVRPAPYETWDDVTPYFQVAKALRAPLQVPAGDRSCIPDSFNTPDRPATPTRSFGLTSVTVKWTKPIEPARTAVVMYELWRPTTSEWTVEGYLSADTADGQLTVKGLSTARQYRFKVAFRNSHGSSEWSRSIEVTPGSEPGRPTRRLLEVTSSSIAYGWTKPAANGFVVTGYDVAIRRQVKGVWGEWTQIKNATPYYRFRDLRAGATYQVRARAINKIGPGPWSRSTTTTTLTA